MANETTTMASRVFGVDFVRALRMSTPLFLVLVCCCLSLILCLSV